MDKQIEEMAKSYCINKYKCNTDCVFQKTEVCEIYETCENLYNAGYRKIPENAVVLTMEEWEKYQTTQRDWNAIYFDGIEKARKETAEKLLDKVDYESNGQTKAITDLLRKEYGV